MVHLVRVFFLLVVLGITVSYAFIPEVYSTGQNYITLYILIPVLLALAIVVVDTFWHHKRLQMLSGVFFGVLAGLAIAYMLSLIVDLVVSIMPAPPPAADPGTLQNWVNQNDIQSRSQIQQTAALSPTEQNLAQAFLAVLGSSKGADQPATAPAAAAVGPSSSQPTAIAATSPAHVGPPRERALTQSQYEAYESALEAFNRYSIHIKTIQMIKLLLGAVSVFMCVSFVMQTKDDFRFVIPYVEFTKQTKGARPLLLDTSVIIDGRIADIADTRILESEMIVPRFVLAELQAIADSEDKLKRNRGRRGLDVLNRLQSSEKIEIRLMDAHVATVDDAADVDAKLVALAKHLDGRIVTNDYNLNKISQLRGVDVININDLANALKPIVLPGETMTVKIIKPGEEAGQGVGYLEDGTMVVAEQGRECIGKEVTIIVTSVLQTSAGRMIFGRLDIDRSFRRDRHVPGSAGHGAAGQAVAGAQSPQSGQRPLASSHQQSTVQPPPQNKPTPPQQGSETRKA